MFTERFWTKVRVTPSCWHWEGSTNARGYGNCTIGGSARAAHRVAYEAAKGTIPSGLQIDHLCRNRLCVNPSHLEAVTQRENILRGESPAARAARATHCPQGHPYDEENTYFYRRGRQCLTCRRARASEQNARRAASRA